MSTQQVTVTSAQIVSAKAHIQQGIEAGRTSTDVDLTATGVLAHVLLDLGIALKVGS